MNLVSKAVNEIFRPGRTVLAVGAISKNCVDAAIEFANEKEIPIILIASRSQVDMKEMGGGYVNHWNTVEFSAYVRNKDKKHLVYIERDHGGPRQNSIELGMDMKKSMANAMRSFEEDILSQFDILHIDTSLIKDQQLDCMFELYDSCNQFAQKLGRTIYFEVEVNGQSEYIQDVEELNDILQKFHTFCSLHKYSLPIFFVIQIGTKVFEMRNIGNLSIHEGHLIERKRIDKLIRLAKAFGVHTKVHNADYLSPQLLATFPEIGIDGANIAPELGVLESRTIIRLLKDCKLFTQLHDFYQLSILSRKWEKWTNPDSHITDEERAVISGHYVFSSPEFTKIKQTLCNVIKKTEQELDFIIKNEIKKRLEVYLTSFRYD